MTPIRSFLMVSISALVLTACADKVPPPQIRYDAAEQQPAQLEPQAAKPVEIVAMPEPLPLPGQLQPLDTAKPKLDKRVPMERVDAANKEALIEPVRDGYINAIQVYPFTEGALYQLYAAPERISDIALQPGEELIAVSAGDTVRWVIGDTVSGSGTGKRVHVLVKPFAAGLETNLVITTDRRAYHLALQSTEATAMAALSWTYPRDELLALQARNTRAEATSAIAGGIDLTSLRFRYEITGDDPPWRPRRAFDDGSKVYIEFPARLDQGEAPPLFVVGASSGSELVNYRLRGHYYIVDRLFAAAELRLGETPQQVVRISRTDRVADTGDDRRVRLRPGR
ncbi:MAG: P-type conjugative transfer protein TrbG [Parvibaculum sp.]